MDLATAVAVATVSECCVGSAITLVRFVCFDAAIERALRGGVGPTRRCAGLNPSSPYQDCNSGSTLSANSRMLASASSWGMPP